MTDGMKTSEFYLAIASFVMGLIMLITGTIKKDAEMIDRGTNLIMTSVGSYSVARGLKKLTIPNAPAPVAESSAEAVANAKSK